MYIGIPIFPRFTDEQIFFMIKNIKKHKQILDLCGSKQIYDFELNKCSRLKEGMKKKK